MDHSNAVVAHWSGEWDEKAVERWAANVRLRLRAPSVSLGVLFASPQYFDHAEELLEVLRVHARIPVLIGCSSPGLIANDLELEDKTGFVLGLYHLPGATLQGFHFNQESLGEEAGTDWVRRSGVKPGDCRGWLVLADPFHMEGERWLREWNHAYPHVPAVGGLAGGGAEQRTQVYLDGQVHEEGGVALAVGGAVALEPMVSQGCTPIGQHWTITGSNRNLILSIGNRPAYEVLVETWNSLPKEEQQLSQGNLFIGLASDEYREDFHRGDFLVRNLLGADPRQGVLAVGAMPRTGQTLQFQRRDAATATQDLIQRLEATRTRLGRRPVYGGVLCACGGRGQRLFGRPNHDAGLTQEQLGPLPVAGFFGNGELGPVGGVNCLHGYTAALGLFVGDAP